MMSPGRTAASVCLLLWAGCASGLSQVSARQKHGSLRFRVVHPDGLYQDYVRLDHEPEVELDGEQRARLRPGPHDLRLRSRLASYELKEQTVRRPYAQCVGATCAQYMPVDETRLGLVRTPGSLVCSEELRVDVVEGQELLVLLVAGSTAKGKHCESCVSHELSSRACR